MSHWVWMTKSSKRRLTNWAVKCGLRWEKNLPGIQTESWAAGRRFVFITVPPPQRHSQRYVQWAYFLRNYTTEKWRRRETRAERSALFAAWPCGSNTQEPGGLPDLFRPGHRLSQIDRPLSGAGSDPLHLNQERGETLETASPTPIPPPPSPFDQRVTCP